MKTILLLSIATFAPARAGVVTENTTPATVGIPYRWNVSLGQNDSASASRHFGAWSWEDDSLFSAGQPPVGWTHTSDWVALSLSQPARFTLTLERNPNVSWPSATDPGRLAPVNSFFPSYSLWQSLDQDTDQLHTYNNRGAVAWAEDLTFVDFVDNSTQTSILRTWLLPAGNYTIALGSNAPATTPDRQGYRATFATAPIPEPGTALFGLACALAGLAARPMRRV